VHLVVAVVPESMDLASVDDYLAGLGSDQVFNGVVAKTHAAAHNRPALLLLRVIVRRQRATRLEPVVDNKAVADELEPADGCG